MPSRFLHNTFTQNKHMQPTKHLQTLKKLLFRSRSKNLTFQIRAGVHNNKIMMASSGLLILCPPASNPNGQLTHLLKTVSKYVSKTLYVQLENDPHKLWQEAKQQPLWTSPAHKAYHYYSKFAKNLYSTTNDICQSLDVRLIVSNLKNPEASISLRQGRPVDFIVTNAATYIPPNALMNYVQTRIKECCKDAEVITTEDSGQDDDNSSASRETLDCDPWTRYDHICVGGTFDRLHNGHKVLLSEAVLLCQKRLVIGVSTGILVERKVLSELIEPYEDRVKHLREFLGDIDDTVQYDIVPLSDPFGPAITDPELQCIVVSDETIRGGQKANEIRNEKKMTPLVVHSIGMMSRDDGREEWENLSSSVGRMKLLGHRRQLKIDKPGLSKCPYIVGLTGGIASGKSTIARRLQEFGAGIIDCDKLCREAYAKDTAGYKKVVKHFGADILSEDGSIDQKILGGIVFENQEKMNKLTEIIWPEIKRLVDANVDQLAKNGTRVIIVEAAVLIEAGWHDSFHEVWVAVIPRNEAIKRIVDRNKISEVQAEKRINQQTSDQDRLQYANVVFCTLWDSKFTQIQVERAWTDLQKYLAGITDS